MSQNAEKDQILDQILPDILFDGWKTQTIIESAEKNDIDLAQLRRLFPNLICDVILHFSDWADRQMVDALALEPMADMRIRDQITLAVKTRLQILAPYKPVMADAMKYMMRPDRSCKMAKAVWRSSDKIWICAGDTSTNYNKYSKRSLLSGVITSTSLYWLNDTSEHQQKTWQFLDNRINNVLTLGKGIGKTRSLLKRIKDKTLQKT